MRSQAESLIDFQHQNPSAAELCDVLGPNWAICDNTPKNKERYRRCITEREYMEAVELALDRRNMDGAGI